LIPFYNRHPIMWWSYIVNHFIFYIYLVYFLLVLNKSDPWFFLKKHRRKRIFCFVIPYLEFKTWRNLQRTENTKFYSVMKIKQLHLLRGVSLTKLSH
jgi:hypothetical protein